MIRLLDSGATVEYVPDPRNGDFYRACYNGKCRCAEDDHIASLYAELLVKQANGSQAG